MASALFFLDLKGKTLLARNYRGDIPMSAVEKFPVLLSEAEEESSAVPPCFSHEGINVCPLFIFSRLYSQHRAPADRW
jgi:AP-1 complex subunit mu